MFVTALAFSDNATAFSNSTLAGGSTAANATVEAGNMAAAAANVPPPVDFSWLGYFEAIGVMFMLLGALWALLWLIRRYGKFRFLPAPGNFPPNGLRIEAQLPLGPRRGLYVIHYLGERLLIGVTEQQITLLQESSWPGAAPAEPQGMTPDHPDAQRFARMLQRERDDADSLQDPLSPSGRHDK